MPFDLSALTPMHATRLSIRGQEATVRALSTAEASALLAVMPRPIAPLGPNPAAGSDSPWVPNEVDAKYQKELTAWQRRRLIVESAAAIDLRAAVDKRGDLTFKDCSTPEERSNWITNAEAAMADALTDAEVIAIHNAMVKASAAGTEAALKN